jgi:peptidoglycan/LPS O-acetylase OafA/YrhL
MPRSFSLYLDLVRFLAAILVYLYHSNFRFLSKSIVPMSHLGHEAVVVFFVLSGYVIAYITHTKENNLLDYCASRASRIYSVAVPVLLITPFLDLAGKQLYPEIYEGHSTDDYPLVRLASSLVFTNELWKVSIMSFSNVPYWSLCYEVWYYVLFGFWVFARKGQRIWWCAGVALLLGPKILLLAPVWWMGVWLYHDRRLKSLSTPVSAVLAVVSGLGIFAFCAFDLTYFFADHMKEWLGDYWYHEMAFSRYFIGDYPLGVMIVLHFAGMRGIAAWIAPLLLPFEAPIRNVAAYTFTLYLMHDPLLLFWGAVLQGDPEGQTFYWETTFLVALCVFAMGWLTENKRHLLKRWIKARMRNSKVFAAATAP